MSNWIKDRENKLRSFFDVSGETSLVAPEIIEAFDVSPAVANHLENFNFEWHIIPSEDAIPIESSSYGKKLYPMAALESNPNEYKKTSIYRAVINGHSRHQGRIIAVETTPKPKYLPNNDQLYGTLYGFQDRDPLTPYMRRAGFRTGSRFDHNYSALRKFAQLVNDDWESRSLMPDGYRLTICPPVIFNLIGTIFHPEWSFTESLEVGFYMDEHGTANGFVVGSNEPNDFSYLDFIEIGSDWKHIGFRFALVPKK